MSSQYLHLGSYPRKPRKGEPRWSCIGGVTAEGARVPSASRHIPFPSEPKVLHGISPLEAGAIAEERADRALDATGKRKLRCDGIALFAGVVSYPTPRAAVDGDPLDKDIYALWKRKTLVWLLAQFAEHLLSVIEHADENYYHLHFFVVPQLDERRRLNVNRVHPGRYAKVVALAEGADNKNAERSYRKGMSAWQDDYHREVSAFFHHDRYGPRRARVSRREREMVKKLEEKQARLDAELEAKSAAFEQETERRRAALDRRCAQITEEAEQRAWQAYAKPNADLRAAYTALKSRQLLERTQHMAEIATLRARLSELEPEVPESLVA